MVDRIPIWNPADGGVRHDHRASVQIIIDGIIAVVIPIVPEFCRIRIDAGDEVLTVLESIESILVAIEVENHRIRLRNTDLVAILEPITIGIVVIRVGAEIVIFIEIVESIRIRIEFGKALVDDIVAIVVLAIERLRKKWCALRIIILTILEPIPAILIVIRIGPKRIRSVGIHFKSIGQAIAVRVAVERIGREVVILVVIIESI